MNLFWKYDYEHSPGICWVIIESMTQECCFSLYTLKNRNSVDCLQGNIKQLRDSNIQPSQKAWFTTKMSFSACLLKVTWDISASLLSLSLFLTVGRGCPLKSISCAFIPRFQLVAIELGYLSWFSLAGHVESKLLFNNINHII